MVLESGFEHHHLDWNASRNLNTRGRIGWVVLKDDLRGIANVIDIVRQEEGIRAEKETQHRTNRHPDENLGIDLHTFFDSCSATTRSRRPRCRARLSQSVVPRL